MKWEGEWREKEDSPMSWPSLCNSTLDILEAVALVLLSNYNIINLDVSTIRPLILMTN